MVERAVRRGYREGVAAGTLDNDRLLDGDDGAALADDAEAELVFRVLADVATGGPEDPIGRRG